MDALAPPDRFAPPPAAAAAAVPPPALAAFLAAILAARRSASLWSVQWSEWRDGGASSRVAALTLRCEPPRPTQSQQSRKSPSSCQLWQRASERVLDPRHLCKCECTNVLAAPLCSNAVNVIGVSSTARPKKHCHSRWFPRDMAQSKVQRQCAVTLEV